MWNRRTSNFTWLFRSIGRRCFCMAHLPLQQLHIFPQSPVLRRQGQRPARLLQGQYGPPRVVKGLTAQIMGQAAPRLRLADVGTRTLPDRQGLTGGIQHTVQGRPGPKTAWMPPAHPATPPAAWPGGASGCGYYPPTVPETGTPGPDSAYSGRPPGPPPQTAPAGSGTVPGIFPDPGDGPAGPLPLPP